ncbi:DUF3572 family protein [Stakelama saccharophila]|uniref:DUF3572 family protein n=1 Tax=Stakelama saccharophila TaxID=3075605 RepID=A0ABZ0BBM8_9SPHN|nr:DUF3572 family protein [Stakelama sp. W311]WNO54248.1 DUF3572 family protein [Stakelama sp. W311]
MPLGETNANAAILALGALAWIVATPERANRYLDVTGIDLDTLRAQADEPAFMAATLAYLEAHEPDLLACAAALDVTPEALVGARRKLENP